MPTAQTKDGAQIHYEKRGTGPTNLAMISGWGGVGGLWFSVAPFLPRAQTAQLPSGHFAPLEYPAQLAALISLFAASRLR